MGGYLLTYPNIGGRKSIRSLPGEIHLTFTVKLYGFYGALKNFLQHSYPLFCRRFATESHLISHSTADRKHVQALINESYHRRRTLRTSLNTEPGSQPEASLSQHQHTSLTDTDEGRSDLAIDTHKTSVFICIIHNDIHNYHRTRWWPADSFPAEEPTYSRCHDMPGMLLPERNRTETVCINSW